MKRDDAYSLAKNVAATKGVVGVVLVFRDTAKRELGTCFATASAHKDDLRRFIVNDLIDMKGLPWGSIHPCDRKEK